MTKSEDIVARLRKVTVDELPNDWQKGRKCPECGSRADRPKCFYDMGPNCPRHDPDNYEDSPYIEKPDPLCNEAADEIERLRARLERQKGLLGELEDIIQKIRPSVEKGKENFKQDYNIIYLQQKCFDNCETGRLWCADTLNFEACDECDDYEEGCSGEPTPYIRGDLFLSLADFAVSTNEWVEQEVLEEANSIELAKIKELIHEPKCSRCGATSDFEASTMCKSFLMDGPCPGTEFPLAELWSFAGSDRPDAEE